MTLQEKKTLVRLLEIYKNEQLENIEENRQSLKIAEEQGKNKWECELKCGCKAQYHHARVIITRLAAEIEKELPSYWDM